MANAFLILSALLILVTALVALGLRRRRRPSAWIVPGPGMRLQGDLSSSSGQTAAEAGRGRGRAAVRPLGPDDRDRFLVAWRSTRSRFVEDPAQAIAEADRLLVDIMEARAFPMVDFDQGGSELSERHPVVVEHYRSARRIARQSEAGAASTDALRKGMDHYQALLDDLLEVETRPSPSGM